MASLSGSEDWRVLCEMASKEMDSDKLLDLVDKLNRALDEHNQQRRFGKIKIATIIPPGTTNAAEHHC
jgi:hypothetical protein